MGGKLTLNAGNNDIGTSENPIVIKNGTGSVIPTGKNIYLTSAANNFNLIAPKTAAAANLVEALEAAKLATVANNGGMTNLRSGGSVYIDLSSNKGYYFPSSRELLT